jgi:hypothetical protein
MNIARFPTLTVGVVAAALQVVSGLWLHWSPDQSAVVNAVVVAAAGVITAWLVKGDALVAALVGLGQALLALTLGFGLTLDTPTQAAIMTLVSALAAAYVHTQVAGPVPAEVGSSPLEHAVPRRP